MASLLSGTRSLSLAVFLVVGTAVSADGQAPPGGGRSGPGGGGGVQADRKLVEQFDKDGDQRLDLAERKAAREWLATQPQGGRGGFGGGGFPGGGPPPGGPPTGGPPGTGNPGGPPPGMFPGGGGRGGPVGGFSPASAGQKLTPAQVTQYPEGSLYALDTIRTLFLEFENADWEQELEAFNNTDVEVPAVVHADGQTYRDVGVHFRGASSYMMVPRGSKRSLNLSFDWVVDGQAIHGYRTLNLLNAMNDATFLRTVFYAHVARQYLPAPKVNWVRVVINGEDWGLYANQQQFNRDFLREEYGTTSGARWQTPGSPGGRAGLQYIGDDPEPYKRLYELKTNDTPARWESLIRVARVLDQTPPAQLERALGLVLDVDGALRFLALEVVMVNSDGYWSRASDYSLYEDAAGRFHVLPHDMNEAMQAGGGGGPGGGGGGVRLDPLVGLEDATKPLRSKLLAVPALRARYLGYVREIATTWLDWATVGPLVTGWQRNLAPVVGADTRKLYSTERFTGDVEGLKNFMAQRREFLLQRLAELGA